MNREILFRGKRLDNGEWVEGDFISSAAYKDRAWITEFKTLFDGEIGGIGVREVDPTTVGQWTGLTDRAGKRIFDGDIVRYIYEPGEGFWNANQLSVVGWEHTGFRLDGIIGTNKFALLTGWLVSVPCDKKFFEVIGNIHDNPELLSGGEK